MTTDERDANAPEEHVIESASATTSRDNANSGNAAYVMFGVVVAVLFLLLFGVSSCTSALGDATARGLGDAVSGWEWEYRLEWGDEPRGNDGMDGLEDLYYYDDLYGSGLDGRLDA